MRMTEICTPECSSIDSAPRRHNIEIQIQIDTSSRSPFDCKNAKYILMCSVSATSRDVDGSDSWCATVASGRVLAGRVHTVHTCHRLEIQSVYLHYYEPASASITTLAIRATVPARPRPLTVQSLRAPPAWSHARTSRTSSSTPSSMGKTTVCVVRKVSPRALRTRGCHPSGIRSSSRNEYRSCTRPPQTVSSIDALAHRTAIKESHVSNHVGERAEEGRDPLGCGEDLL